MLGPDGMFTVTSDPNELIYNFFYDIIGVNPPILGGNYLLRNTIELNCSNRDNYFDGLEGIVDNTSIRINRQTYRNPIGSKWHIIISQILHDSTIERKMEGLMLWVMHDPQKHAEFIYNIFDKVFNKKETQFLPSMRVTPSDGQNYLRIREAYDAQIANYKLFLQTIWIPYLKVHPSMDSALFKMLLDADQSSAAFLEIATSFDITWMDQERRLHSLTDPRRVC